VSGAVLSALLSHWRRHPLQLAMLVIGLALATALWSGVQAINAEARAAYARAAASLGQDRLERLVPAPGTSLTTAAYAALRQAGWPVSPVLEGSDATGLRILGIEPLTLPAAAATPGVPALGSSDLGDFLRGRAALAAPETLARPRLAEALRGVTLLPAPDLPPMTVLADIALAERLLDRSGEISALLIDPARPLPGPVPAGLILRAPAADDGLARLTDSFHLNLTAFGVLAFAVGIFIVHAAIGLAFEGRRGVMRTLRALGVPARLLAGFVIVELVALALAAGLIGVGLGYLLAAALLPDVAATLGGLYGAAVPGTLALRPGWAVAGLAMAVGGTLAAGAQGIWQLLRLPPLVSAAPRAWALAAAGVRRWQALAGLGLLAGAGIVLAQGDGLWAGFAGLAGLLLGAALVLPAGLAAGLRVAEGRARGVRSYWFWADARHQLPGLSLAMMALLLALAANVGVGTMVASFRATFTGWLDQRLASELYLSAQSPAEAAAMRDWLAPRVDAILPIAAADTPLLGRPGEVYGVADHATYRDHWPLLDSRPDTWDRIADGTGLLVNEQLFRRARIRLGDPVELPGGPVPVVGVYSDYGNPAPQAMLGMESFRARFPAVEITRFALRLPAERAGPLAEELRQAFALTEGALIDQAGIKAFSLQVFERTFAVTAALNILTLGVAVVAILTSLLTLADRRLPQLAPAWAMGMTQRHLALLDIGRTLVLALLTAVAALPLGLALAWVLLAVVNVAAFGWRLPMQVFPADWLRLILAALLAAAAAGAIPALRLMRRQPAELLRVFANER
jgi:putative ABC transport system permease protein